MPAKSPEQARFFRLVRLCQDKKKCLSKEIENVSDNISVKKAHEFASTTDAEIMGRDKKNNKPKSGKKKKTNESTGFTTFQNYFLLRESKGCTCPCNSCKKNKDCKNCEHENCKYEGCNCH